VHRLLEKKCGKIRLAVVKNLKINGGMNEFEMCNGEPNDLAIVGGRHG
jgi:hypothetical protein